MFRNRKGQKPSDELYKSFKDNFSQFNQNPAATDASAQATTSLAEALDLNISHATMDAQHRDIKEQHPSPQADSDAWNFAPSGLTPSMMDPNSHTFNMFANQMPGYYTPTPGGTNTLYHPQAGDLHTPGFGMGLGTPLSLPTSEGALHAGHQAPVFQGFHPHLQQHITQQPFQNVNPFHMHQDGFAPHQFTNQPSYEQMGRHTAESPVDDMNLDSNMLPNTHSPQMLLHSQGVHHSMRPHPLHQSGEKFRYHTTLNAPTAMIKHADEIPVTYLNKGQAYTLNVVDTHAQQGLGPVRYRTFVRVSFEDEQQRAKPAACWQLWKEGRGTNEAHQRGGRLQAVEYVEANHNGGVDDPSKPRMELESASFDGFCVRWSPSAGTAECPISVRFNFLSTDFSHSKGVKGIPVRLCAKTEIISDTVVSSHTAEPEVCYCKVKLFRDHGAERKLSNDVAHVKKTIDKVNQQIAQIESGMRDLGKRKRSGSIARLNGLEARPGKMLKHRRTWSVTSITSSGGRGGAEDDLHVKLMNLQDMFTSTRPASVLHLRGEEGDDPDAWPVKLNGEMLALKRDDSRETCASEAQSSLLEEPSVVVSPTPSANNSLSGSRRDSNMQQPTPVEGTSRTNSSDWRGQTQTATMDLQPVGPQQLASPPDNQPTKVQTRSPTTGNLSNWVDALGVDNTYQPPPERPIKPVACFYVLPRTASHPPRDPYYRAIYLYFRTLKDFINAAARKCQLEPTSVRRVLRVVGNNQLVSLFDDDCVQELPEGTAMVVEVRQVEATSPRRPTREWDAGPTDVQCDGEVMTTENVTTSGYELRLRF